MTSDLRAPSPAGRPSTWLTAGLLALGLGYLTYRIGMDSALGLSRSGSTLLPSVGDAGMLVARLGGLLCIAGFAVALAGAHRLATRLERAAPLVADDSSTPGTQTRH